MLEDECPISAETLVVTLDVVERFEDNPQKAVLKKTGVSNEQFAEMLEGKCEDPNLYRLVLKRAFRIALVPYRISPNMDIQSSCSSKEQFDMLMDGTATLDAYDAFFRFLNSAKQIAIGHKAKRKKTSPALPNELFSKKSQKPRKTTKRRKPVGPYAEYARIIFSMMEKSGVTISDIVSFNHISVTAVLDMLNGKYPKESLYLKVTDQFKDKSIIQHSFRREIKHREYVKSSYGGSSQRTQKESGSVYKPLRCGRK